MSGTIHILRAFAEVVRQDDQGPRLRNLEVLALLVHLDQGIKDPNRDRDIKLLITDADFHPFYESPNVLGLPRISRLRAIG